MLSEDVRCRAGDVWLNKQCPVDTKDGVLTQRSAVDQPDSAFRPAQQKHKGAADERAVVDRVLLTSNDDAQARRGLSAQFALRLVMQSGRDGLMSMRARRLCHRVSTACAAECYMSTKIGSCNHPHHGASIKY